MQVNFMPSLMPSLFKYFTVVGAVLVVGLIGLNAVLEPGGPGPSMVKPQPKARPIRHDPDASLVERLRTEEAAQKAAAKDETNAPAPQPVTVAAPATPAPAPAQPVQPVTQAAPAAAIEPAQSVPAALTGVPTEDGAARATRLAQEKIAAEKARKKRIARAHARAKAIDEASAARQQDQIYYGYAPRPTYGPFGQGGGWQNGGGWNRGW
jgi:type IV secretory pathway VirB10-like protein